MNDKYIIKEINSSEVDNIARLYTISFGRSVNADVFKWKYFENPQGAPLCLGAKVEENLVGALTIVPEEFYVFGEKNKVYKCIDLMVLPEHRGLWLPNKLVASISEQLKRTNSLFIYSLCAKYVTLFFLRRKWIKLDDLEWYFKHKSQLKIKFLFHNLDKLYNKGILRQINSISELCRNYKFKIDDTKIHIVKDEKYFRWRLKDPRFKYKIIGYYEKDKLSGYIIYNTGIKNNAYIIDLEANNDNAKIIETLLSSVELATYRANCKSIIALTIKDSPFQMLIKKNKYIKNPFRKGPLSNTIDFDALIDEKYNNGLSNKSNWDIYPLSYDAV